MKYLIIFVVLVAVVASSHENDREKPQSLEKRLQPVDSVVDAIHRIASEVKTFVGMLPFGGLGLNASIDRLMDIIVEYSDQASGTVDTVANEGLVQFSKYIVVGVDFFDGYSKIIRDVVSEFEPKVLVDMLGQRQVEVAAFLEQLHQLTDQLRVNAVNALNAAGIKLNESTAAPQGTSEPPVASSSRPRRTRGTRPSGLFGR